MLKSVSQWRSYLQTRNEIVKIGLFDRSFYRSQIPGSFIPGFLLLQHYIQIGGYAGLNPSSEFDSSFYYKRYPDVKQAKINPLLHYLQYGRYEGRFRNASDEEESLKEQNTDYQRWIDLYEMKPVNSEEIIQSDLKRFRNIPKFSVIMPVWNPEPAWLEEAICSVTGQLYPSWELCIADDCSTNPEIRSTLEYFEKKDERIKVTWRNINGHISAASNTALESATGDYIILLDHDDILSPFAMYYAAKTINEHPGAILLFSDEDKIDNKGFRQSPYFKSDWNPELFFSQNMISHLGIYRTDIVRKTGGFRPGYEGSQDYDLALRITEMAGAENIVHIPRILYHWRIHEYSTSLSGDNKSYASTAACRALTGYFARNLMQVKVSVISPGFYRTVFSLPQPEPQVTIIIPTRNQYNLLKKCVKSILEKTDYGTYDILIMDNDSDDPATQEYLDEVGQNDFITVIRDDRPFNYSAINNLAAGHARGEFLVLLNNDVEVISSGWLKEMVSHAARPGVGAVGAKLFYPDGTIQHAGVILGLGGVAGHPYLRWPGESPGYFGKAILVQEISAVTAACLAVKKQTYLAVGGMDETNLKIAFNDIDFCLKLREAGYRNIWTPNAKLIHHESASRGGDNNSILSERFRNEISYMVERWGPKLNNDPFYNPNLSLVNGNYTLAWPPRHPEFFKPNNLPATDQRSNIFWNKIGQFFQPKGIRRW